MSFAYRCPQTGLVEFADREGAVRCPTCGQRHETFRTGPPVRPKGPPAVRQDSLRKHYDWSVGAWVDSRSQKKRLYDDAGLIEKSMDDHRKQFPETFDKYFRTRDRVRSSDGHRVQ